jgi:hypothetical protein
LQDRLHCSKRCSVMMTPIGVHAENATLLTTVGSMYACHVRNIMLVTITHICAACLQGEVPEYLMEYFNYITSLSPQEVPDYQYLMMLLDRGVTGQPPVRPPARRRLSDWPTSDEWDVRRDYAKVGRRWPFYTNKACDAARDTVGIVVPCGLSHGPCSTVVGHAALCSC